MTTSTEVEFGVLLPSGEVKVYGDQDWVRSGQAIVDAHPDGEIVQRAITRVEGPWLRAGDGDAR